MPFTQSKSLADVSLLYRIRLEVDSFVQPSPLAVDERLEAELIFALRQFNVRVSETSISESLIAPVLKEVWKPYVYDRLFWSHTPFGAEEPLVGIPDYYFSQRTRLGMAPELPFVLIIQAKRDDFEEGWGQCLAAMLAAQRQNQPPTRVVYGCVSNGDLWQFGKLDHDTFTRELRSFILSDLPGLFSAWNYVFAQAREQSLAPAA